jgi:hypothetical protein
MCDDLLRNSNSKFSFLIKLCLIIWGRNPWTDLDRDLEWYQSEYFVEVLVFIRSFTLRLLVDISTIHLLMEAKVLVIPWMRSSDLYYGWHYSFICLEISHSMDNWIARLYQQCSIIGALRVAIYYVDIYCIVKSNTVSTVKQYLFGAWNVSITHHWNYVKAFLCAGTEPQQVIFINDMNIIIYIHFQHA